MMRNLKIIFSMVIFSMMLVSDKSQAQYWQTSGNTSLGSSDYIGTSAAVSQDLRFKVKGIQRMLISRASGNVAIGNSTSPNSFARLDITGTGKGILIPRMLQSELPSISSSPPAGLLIYQTDNSPGVYEFNGTEWISDWKVGGNSWTVSSPEYKSFGTNSCHALFMKANGVTCLALYPSCLTSSGEFEVRTFDGGVVGTGTKEAFHYDWSAPIALLPQFDRVRITEPDTLSILKGFVYKAPGTNATATLSAINTSTVAGTLNAIMAYSVPQPGYGAGLKAAGGNTGVYGKGLGSGYNLSPVYGLYGYAAGIPAIGTRVGVYGKGDSAKVTIGIYGSAGFGTDTTRAGYFSGILEHTGIIVGPSDEKLKENILPFSGALEKINKLNVKTYNFKREYDFMHLPKGIQIGLVSQELEKVFPEMVVGSVHPADFDPESLEKISDEVHYKSVNYEGLIPVLIEGIKEQQTQIEELKKIQEAVNELRKENDDLKNQIAQMNAATHLPLNKSMELMSGGRAVLEQNTPNPFSEKTSISYFIPEVFEHTYINIYSQEKKLLKSYLLTKSGSGEISIEGNMFNAGTYLYELVVNSKVVDTKKMILSR